MRAIRWLLAIAAIPAGILLFVILVMLIGDLEGMIDPQRQGMPVLRTTIASAIGAFVTVYAPAKLAPKFKRAVALSSYCVGAIFAFAFTVPFGSVLFLPFLLAILTGYLTYRHVRLSARQILA